MKLRKFRNRDLLTDAELQELLGVSRATLWRLRKADGIPYSKVGRQYPTSRRKSWNGSDGRGVGTGSDTVDDGSGHPFRYLPILVR